jgi:mannose-6-phosphate isomerase-like protein (cupin superfamily)
VLSDPLDQPDGVLVAELHVRSGGRVVVAHRHPGLVERFYVLRGEVGFLIGSAEELLGPGRSAEVPAEVLHD